MASGMMKICLVEKFEAAVSYQMASLLTQECSVMSLKQS